jgi:DNA polymerase-3 subunit gamma/tau
VLEEMLGAVERNSSEEVLTLVDRLMVEGHNPTHFARQMVRFLRNSIVAKVAGKDTSLLQISRDEAERVARVARNFSEEDLTRFLQIMLRTHSELGYKHEQRFHLELGLLKLVHAQRLLPMEQILSGEPVTSSTRTAAPVARTSVTEAPGATPRAARSASPFESDVARKRPEPRGGMSTSPTIEGTSAVAVATAPEPLPEIVGGASELSLPKIQTATLSAMEKSGQKMIAHWMELGEWKIQGNEVVVAVGATQPMIDAALKGEAQRALNQSATEAAGQSVRVKLIAGKSGNGNGSTPKPVVSDGSDARSRALNDPIVKKMREKFGGEIRTVIDQRNKH